MNRKLFTIFTVAGFFLTFFLILSGCQERPIDFSTEVKPILNKRCITCHGGVKRNGGFSLLFRKDALAANESGSPAIIPGNPGQSEMIRRLTHADPKLRMPYGEEALPEAEIALLTKWVKQGANWGDHWAYVPPVQPPVPDVSNENNWAQHAIDHFVLDRLHNEGLTPSKEAEKAQLLRRVYLDLIGLPPTPEEAAAFFADDQPQAYAQVVDRLLNSPHYGEKWASWWLDMARYSDTKGYERDLGRIIWRYRDWVIKAFNEDMPFDQFTIEQLAGDLLPAPTDAQLTATAFHRNTMSNDEGGTEDEEFRVAAVIDRVNTTMEVWQSTTFSCVQCHSHPYDPFRHEEYYTFMAFLNNTRDEDLTNEHPKLRLYKEADQEKIKRLTGWVEGQSGETDAKALQQFLRTLEPKYHPHDCDQFVNSELMDTKWLGIRSGGSCRLANIPLDGKTNLLLKYWTETAGGSFEIRKNKVDGAVIARAKLASTSGKRQVIQIPLEAGTGIADLYLLMYNSGIPAGRPVCGVEWLAFRGDLAEAPPMTMQSEFLELLNTDVEETPILIENDQEQFRPTYLFERGNWLVHGKEVYPDVPEYLNELAPDQPKNRLGLARWLVSPENPLTARTLVNRFWEQLFGRGIVTTLEDFGTQGAGPSHPELLDWLAWQLMHDYQWSMKRLLREIVLSTTYRQDARLTPELLERDPDNRLLARGPRVRLSAEQIRDQTLAVSGLLSTKMYGPSVMPYQPDGVWQTVYNGASWQMSTGEDLNRRAVYTYAKRTSPYPSAIMFDGSSREVCTVARIRTNTPLQALVALNDPVYLEAARQFARQMRKEAESVAGQIKSGYKRAMFREIPDTKLAVFVELYERSLQKYQANQMASAKLMKQEREDPELAALTIVANAMLNLDEFVMKE